MKKLSRTAATAALEIMVEMLQRSHGREDLAWYALSGHLQACAEHGLKTDAARRWLEQLCARLHPIVAQALREEARPELETLLRDAQRARERGKQHRANPVADAIEVR